MATRKPAVKVGKQKHLSGRNHEVPGSIFGADGSDMIPGEVIVQLDDTMSARLTESIPSGPMRGSVFAGTMAFDATLLQDLGDLLGVRHIAVVARLAGAADDAAH